MTKKQETQTQKIDLKTVDIKGKAYVQVNERVRVFRQDERYSGWALITSPLKVSDAEAFFEAKILNDKGVLIANGHARELQSSSFINKTSYIENAETSAIGRALGNLGIGIESSFCTADELLIAMAGQGEKIPTQSVQQQPVKKTTTIILDKITQEQEMKIRDLEQGLAMPPANLSTMNLESAKKYFVILTNEYKKREKEGLL
jgi:hypothetical protein